MNAAADRQIQVADELGETGWADEMVIAERFEALDGYLAEFVRVEDSNPTQHVWLVTDLADDTKLVYRTNEGIEAAPADHRRSTMNVFYFRRLSVQFCKDAPRWRRGRVYFDWTRADQSIRVRKVKWNA